MCFDSIPGILNMLNLSFLPASEPESDGARGGPKHQNSTMFQPKRALKDWKCFGSTNYMYTFPEEGEGLRPQSAHCDEADGHTFLRVASGLIVRPSLSLCFLMYFHTALVTSVHHCCSRSAVVVLICSYTAGA